MKTLVKIVHIIKNFLAKSKIDNFLGGLLIGAFITLILNLLTIYITDAISRQRALESIENEITTNNIQANIIIGQNNKSYKDKSLPNIFYTFHLYNDTAWNNPSTTQYIEQLDPKVQGEIDAYYQYAIKGINAQDAKLNTISTTILQPCFQYAHLLTVTEDQYCRAANIDLLGSESRGADYVVSSGLKLLNDFHPTRDRLNNPFLILFMTNKAIGALKVPPKLN